MPRPLSALISEAEAADLARRFLDNPPDREVAETPVEALRRAAAARLLAERDLVDAVRAARRAGATWADVGAAVGTTGEAARQRYTSVAA